jgi:uncharacterized repeat protein (TIGR01451 family)
MNSGPRTHRTRLLSVALALPAVLVLGLISFTGGASAVVGDTDLSLTKTDSPDPVVQNGTLTYTITVKNLGPGDATGVKVTDVLTKDVSFTTATASVGSCQEQKGTVTCDLGQVNAGVTATVTIVVKPKHAGTISNTASVSTTVADTNTANNQATATTVVTGSPGNGKGKTASCASPTIVGTAGNDVIVGTTGKDVIVTLSGSDLIFAGGGNDVVCAGSGRDKVIGDIGNDVLKGNRGRDRLRGVAGNDTLNGGRNHDKCRGGPGRDTKISCP